LEHAEQHAAGLHLLDERQRRRLHAQDHVRVARYAGCIRCLRHPGKRFITIVRGHACTRLHHHLCAQIQILLDHVRHDRQASFTDNGLGRHSD